jgi:hypothetical protein
MFIEKKEGRQYSFSLELSSQDLSNQNLIDFASIFDRSLHKEKDVKEIQYKDNFDIPIRVFREGNSGLRAIVVYLHEYKKLSFIEISRLLNRDQRTIWTSYNSAKKIPHSPAKKYSPDEPTINSSTFKNRDLSILESVANSLLSKYTVNETAQLLGKNKMTIWTVKRRAAQKNKDKRGNK